MNLRYTCVFFLLFSVLIAGCGMHSSIIQEIDDRAWKIGILRAEPCYWKFDEGDALVLIIEWEERKEIVAVKFLLNSKHDLFIATMPSVGDEVWRKRKVIIVDGVEYYFTTLSNNLADL